MKQTTTHHKRFTLLSDRRVKLSYYSKIISQHSTLFTFFFLVLYLLSFLPGSAQSRVKSQNNNDTLWLSTPGLTSLNSNGDACYMLLGALQENHLLQKQPSTYLRTIISGNITYDYLYRSLVDTPFYTKNFQQHTISADVRVLYRGVYPINFRFQVRKSNQPLFKDFRDINIKFEPHDFQRVIERRIKDLILNRSLSPRIQKLQKTTEQLRIEQEQLNSFVKSPAIVQRIIESRERALVKKGISVPNRKVRPDSIELDLEDSALIYRYQHSIERLATLRNEIKQSEDSLQIIKNQVADSLHFVDGSLSKLKGAKLKEAITDYHLPEDSLPKGYRKLIAIRQISVGRNIINYSELTAKNISITGLNVEYNPSWYAAAAIGFTDWQFRDFRVQPNKLPKQYLALARFGLGSRDKNSIIFSYFTGKRNLLAQSNLNNSTLSSYDISGMSIEGIYHLYPNQQLCVEIAKSSYPKYVSINPLSGKPFDNNWFTMTDRQNEAYSISYKGNFIRTQTELQGNYRRIGQYFQSYAFYTSPGQQDVWNVQLDQQVQKWMSIRLGLQKNQYSFPMLAGGLKNNTIFKTAQLSFHYKRWPVIMAGYYPASQITLINDAVPIESRFYTLNVSANHSYRKMGAFMNSALVYTQFYNEGSDSGFIYYKARNVSFSQMMWIGKWSVQGTYTAIWQYMGRLTILEASSSYKLSELFGLSGGVKYNSLLNANSVIGYSGGLTFVLKKLGSLQGMMDKSYWPGRQHNLLPNTNGGITFIKNI